LFLPWRGHTIIGTTDTFFQDEPDLVATTQEDIDGLLEKAASVHPGAKLSRQDVQHFYVGLRPLVDTDNNPDNNTNTYTASRAAEIVDHEVESNLPGLLSAIGGKWTTSRNVASKVVDKVLEKLPHRLHQAKPCATAHTPIYAGDTGPFAEFSSRLKSNHPNWPEDILDNLAKNYGTKAETVLSIANDHSSPLDRLCEDKPEIAAEIVYTVRHEMALALDDVIFRRTGIGTLGHPGQDVLNRCAEIMAEELGWDEAEKAIQI
jgi:glycerol-3-phosphate dehydrogenase